MLANTLFWSEMILQSCVSQSGKEIAYLCKLISSIDRAHDGKGRIWKDPIMMPSHTVSMWQFFCWPCLAAEENWVRSMHHLLQRLKTSFTVHFFKLYHTLCSDWWRLLPYIRGAPFVWNFSFLRQILGCAPYAKLPCCAEITAHQFGTLFSETHDGLDQHVRSPHHIGPDLRNKLLLSSIAYFECDHCIFNSSAFEYKL